MTKIISSLALILIIAWLPSWQLIAQNPTPLPTKTPTTIPNSQSDNVTPTNSPSTNFEIQEPFIQSDLSILSGNVQRPNGLFWHNGMVYASCNGDWTIYEIEANTGSTITYLWGVRNAHTLFAEDDENGDLNLWVPDFQTNELLRVYQRTTEIIATDLEGPWGIAPNGDDFLITNLLGNNLALVTKDGEVNVVMTDLRSPAGLAIYDDYVFIANNGSARRAIEWVRLNDLDHEAPIQSDDTNTAVGSLISGLQNPTGLVMGPDEKLYFAYSLGTRGVIGRIDPSGCIENGGCTNDEVEIVVYTDLAAPLAGLAISDNMRLFTHTIFSPDIYYIDLAQPDMLSTRR